MPDMSQVAVLSSDSLDQLETRIVLLAQRLNAAEYEFLVAVREFDLRQGWREYQFNNCAEWLNWKCGVAMATGREKLRVAKALYDLPKISDAFATGELSYSNVRALSRVANPRNEQSLIDYARSRTALQVESRCRALRNADRFASRGDVQQLHTQRSVTCHVNLDGSVSISGELTPEDGALLMKALEKAAEQDASRDASFVQQQADALITMARAFLSGDCSGGSTADNYQVVIHADESALKEEAADKESRSDLALDTVRRLSCEGSISRVVENKAGEVIEINGKRRVVHPAMKRALLARDKTCRYPGCSHDKWLDAHHVTHWVDGGATTLDNLMLLCSKHHRLLHEGGFEIHANFEGRWYFRTNRGKILLE